ncbi:MAG TPA: hypothetical protein VNH11_10860 [Pirellulales bacterium]|nr:hypothetical protein [Pirellulales bacterium]
MLRYVFAAVVLLAAIEGETCAADRFARAIAGPPLPAAFAGRYGYGPGWAYSAYYGGPVYYYYANPNARLPPAPSYPTWPSYGFVYSNLYPRGVYNYGWYTFRY